MKDAVLIATVGEQGPVITSTLNKLIEAGHAVREMVVIHTDRRNKVATALNRIEEAFRAWESDAKRGYLFSPEADTEQAQQQRKEILDRIRKEAPDFLLDGEGCLDVTLRTVLIQKADGQAVRDIETKADALAAQQEVYRQVIQAKVKREKPVILSLSGGRNEMIGAGGMAAQCVGVDLVCQVTNAGEREARYKDSMQPPLDKYDLVEVEFVDISNLIRQASRISPGFEDLFEKPDCFRDRLRDLSGWLEGISLISGLMSAHDLKKNGLLLGAIDALRAGKTEDAEMRLWDLRTYLGHLAFVDQAVTKDEDVSGLCSKEEIEQALRLVKNSCADSDKPELSTENLRFDLDVPDGFSISLPRQIVSVCLFNLVINAIRAIRRKSTGEQIRIVGERKENRINLIVEDNGPGFEGNPERFKQPYRHSTNGSGIGIPLVDYLMRKCGANLTLENRSDGVSGARAVIWTEKTL